MRQIKVSTFCSFFLMLCIISLFKFGNGELEKRLMSRKQCLTNSANICLSKIKYDIDMKILN